MQWKTHADSKMVWGNAQIYKNHHPYFNSPEARSWALRSALGYLIMSLAGDKNVFMPRDFALWIPDMRASMALQNSITWEQEEHCICSVPEALDPENGPYQHVYSTFISSFCIMMYPLVVHQLSFLIQTVYFNFELRSSDLSNEYCSSFHLFSIPSPIAHFLHVSNMDLEDPERELRDRF